MLPLVTPYAVFPSPIVFLHNEQQSSSTIICSLIHETTDLSQIRLKGKSGTLPELKKLGCRTPNTVIRFLTHLPQSCQPNWYSVKTTPFQAEANSLPQLLLPLAGHLFVILARPPRFARPLFNIPAGSPGHFAAFPCIFLERFEAM